MKSLNLNIKEHSIGLLEWNQPQSSANLISLSFMEELSSVLQKTEQEQLKALILISKKPNVFCAGADIREIQKMQTQEDVRKALNTAHELFTRLEKLNLFKIAAIEGSCLGGGLELSLCFDYLLLSDSPQTRLGLPEVRLGLIPGFGGCLRLPRRIGLKQSLDMILSGKSRNSRQALQIGLADERAPFLILEKRALQLAEESLKGSRPLTKNHKQKNPSSFYAEKFFKNLFCLFAKKQVLKKTQGFYPAPLKALEVIQKTYDSPLSPKSRKTETEAFCEILKTPESKNLIQVWNMMDRAKKTKPPANSAPLQPIQQVGVLGAGVMGRAIAFLFADKDFQVRLMDIEERALRSALVWSKKLWEEQKRLKKINHYELKQKINSLSVSNNFWGMPHMDLVIEALPENKALKQNVIRDISKKLNPSCLLASNTSSLSISELARASFHPQRFFGLHFFNPAHKMPLLEIVMTEEQKSLFMSRIKILVKKLRKTALFVKDSPGFIVNRVLASYLTESLLMFEEGAEVEHTDRCYRDQFGLPLGPFQLMDKIGLDICAEFISQLKTAGLNFECPQWTAQFDQILGQGEKSGAGFYIYKGKTSSLNPKIKDLKRNQPLSFISDEVIRQRGIYRMINEGKKLGQERISADERDVDLALILGIGWPPFLGGPMRYIEQIDADKIRQNMQELSLRYGQRFEPCF